MINTNAADGIFQSKAPLGYKNNDNKKLKDLK